MAIKEKTKPDLIDTEQQRVSKWRQQRFAEILKGAISEEEIALKVQELDEAKVDLSDFARDFNKLVEKGCEPDVAIRILV